MPYFLKNIHFRIRRAMYCGIYIFGLIWLVPWYLHEFPEHYWWDVPFIISTAGTAVIALITALSNLMDHDLGR